MNIKDIAATLAILGSGALVMTGCGKEQPTSEVPGGESAAPTDVTADGGGEAACAEGHTEEGHCGDAAAGGEGEGSCSGEEGEGSCSGEEGE